MADKKGREARKWPYPVRYGSQSDVTADVLVIGGGLAGAHAAIKAARKGADVVVVEKSITHHSGNAGSGIDHWHDVCGDPACTIPAEELAAMGGGDGAYPLHAAYITCKESFDTLLDLEKMGLPIRDDDFEFDGAPFRDDETGLMYAYDYYSKHCIRIRGGARIKPVLNAELDRLKVRKFDRTMVTSLLTEGGCRGGRVVGATGVNTQTGEFYVFSAKAVVLATGPVSRLWVGQTELVGHNDELWDPCCTGDGQAAAWRAGAEFIDLELGGIPMGGGFMFPPYGVGYPENTWFACSMVDADGKEIPWEDWAGRPLKTVEERNLPAPDQKYFLNAFSPCLPEFKPPRLIRDLPERICAGEFRLPLYADLPGMPEHERRAIWGLMVGNEGKSNVAVYQLYTEAGFNPDIDMLQANVIPPAYMPQVLCAWLHYGPPQWQDAHRVAKVLVDWDLKTSLEGLYAAGQVIGGPGASSASCTGGYAGRKAAEYALGTHEGSISREQVEEEKTRVYAQLEAPERRWTGWKEVHFGIARVMQDYCGVAKSEALATTGLKYLASIRESEAALLWARNPHELVRGLETLNRLDIAEMVLQGTLARKGSNQEPRVMFERLDYPSFDPEEWKNAIVLGLTKDGSIEERRIPREYMLEPPNAPTFAENYCGHCAL